MNQTISLWKLKFSPKDLINNLKNHTNLEIIQYVQRTCKIKKNRFKQISNNILQWVRNISKEETEMTNDRMKTCSTLVVNKDMKSKTTVR